MRVTPLRLLPFKPYHPKLKFSLDSTLYFFPFHYHRFRVVPTTIYYLPEKLRYFTVLCTFRFTGEAFDAPSLGFFF